MRYLSLTLPLTNLPLHATMQVMSDILILKAAQERLMSKETGDIFAVFDTTFSDGVAM